MLAITSNSTYYWSPGSYLNDSSKLNPVAKVNKSVVFYFRASENICWDEDTILVGVYDLPALDIYDPSGIREIDSTLLIVENGSYMISATPGFKSYTWKPAEGLSDTSGQSVVVSALNKEMQYIVYGITFDQCLTSDTIVVSTALDIVIYSGFTPNGDNVNDVWIIENAEQYPDLVVQIYNRWGEKVFESNGYNSQNAWDGTFYKNGKDLPIGTYYYIIDDGINKPVSGPVTIVR